MKSALRRGSILPLSGGDSRFVDLDLFGDPACVFDPASGKHHFNAAWRKVVGDARFASTNWLDWAHDADRPSVEAALSQLQDAQSPLGVEFRLRHGEVHRWFALRAFVREQGRSGDAVALITLSDIHDRKLLELELIWKSHVQAQVLDVSLDCVKVIDPDGTLVFMNRAGCEALNVPLDSPFGMKWLPLLAEEAREPGQSALTEACQGRTGRFHGMSQCPGDIVRHWDNMLTPLVNRHGAIESIVCISRDVTAQHHTQRRIDLLLHELNHRSKNMLAVVQALIRRTVPDRKAPYVEILEQRLSSVARSQDLLIDGSWRGATMKDVIVSQTVLAGDLAETRLLLHGDDNVRVRAEASEAFGLAMHELTTNAIKYGALSNSTGTVSIEWRTEKRGNDEYFLLSWTEKGGPPVATPSRQGFGSSLIGQNPRAIPGASLEHAYGPDGVTWRFEARAEAVVAREP